MKSSTDHAKKRICPEQNESTIRSLYERLQKAPDHCKRRGKRYEAAVVLTLLVLAKTDALWSDELLSQAGLR